jgi:hypothetical protein
VLSNSLESPLLKLPAELRNQIYGYALYEGTLVLTLGVRKGNGNEIRCFTLGLTNGWPHLLALLQVCSQTHAESQFLPFSLNNFRLQLGSKCLYSTLQAMITQFSPMQRANITRMELATSLDSTATNYLIYRFMVERNARGISFSDLLPRVKSVILHNCEHHYWGRDEKAVGHQKAEVKAWYDGGINGEVKVVLKRGNRPFGKTGKPERDWWLTTSVFPVFAF